MNGTISVANTVAASDATNSDNKEVIFKNCVLFTNFISEINNTEIDNAKDIDIEMLVYNLIEYSDNYSKTFGSLWQYYRDEPALTDAVTINDFPGNSALFKFKPKTTGKTENNGTINFHIMVSLKYLNNFWRTVEMPLMNCEINLIPTWSANYFLSNAANQATTFAITNTKIYVPIVTLSIQSNAKLLQQLKSGFKRTINWSKYQSKVTIQAHNRFLYY